MCICVKETHHKYAHAFKIPVSHCGTWYTSLYGKKGKLTGRELSFRRSFFQFLFFNFLNIHVTNEYIRNYYINTNLYFYTLSQNPSLLHVFSIKKFFSM